MLRPLRFVLPALGVSLLLAACGSSSSPVVKTASNSKLGATVLVDAQGMTLYHLSVEQHGKFVCTAGCVKIWAPLTVASGSKPSGPVGSLGTIRRPGGGLQVTYKGEPLYTFAQDTSAGQANGQGVKDVGTWTAVRTGASDRQRPGRADDHQQPEWRTLRVLIQSPGAPSAG